MNHFLDDPLDPIPRCERPQRLGDHPNRGHRRLERAEVHVSAYPGLDFFLAQLLGKVFVQEGDFKIVPILLRRDPQGFENFDRVGIG